MLWRRLDREHKKNNFFVILPYRNGLNQVERVPTSDLNLEVSACSSDVCSRMFIAICSWPDFRHVKLSSVPRQQDTKSSSSHNPYCQGSKHLKNISIFVRCNHFHDPSRTELLFTGKTQLSFIQYTTQAKPSPSAHTWVASPVLPSVWDVQTPERSHYNSLGKLL